MQIPYSWNINRFSTLSNLSVQLLKYDYYTNITFAHNLPVSSSLKRNNFGQLFSESFPFGTTIYLRDFQAHNFEQAGNVIKQAPVETVQRYQTYNQVDNQYYRYWIHRQPYPEAGLVIEKDIAGSEIDYEKFLKLSNRYSLRREYSIEGSSSSSNSVFYYDENGW